MMCTDYVKYLLTGEHTTDFSIISGSSLFDSSNRGYSRELLEIYGIPEDVARAAAAGVGARDRRPRDAGSGGAHRAGRGHARSPAACSTLMPRPSARESSATASSASSPARGASTRSSRSDPIIDKRLYSLSLYAVPDMWLTIEASATSATNLEWFVTQLLLRGTAGGPGARHLGLRRVQREGRHAGARQHRHHLPSLPVRLRCAGDRPRRLLRAGRMAHQDARPPCALRRGRLQPYAPHRKAASGRRAGWTGAHDRRRLAQPRVDADVLRRAATTHRGPRRRRGGRAGVAMAAGIGVGIYRDYADAVAKVVRLERRPSSQTRKPRPPTWPATGSTSACWKP